MNPSRSVTIRAVTVADTSAVLDLARTSGLFPPDQLAELATILTTHLLGDSGERWAVLTEESRVSAVAYYAPERMSDGTWNLYFLAVHPDRHGDGLGTVMVRHVEDELCRDGVRMLVIETSGTADFARQRALYRRLGYDLEARIRDFYEAGDDKIVFTKHLSMPDEGTPGPAAPGSGLRPADDADVATLLDLAEAFYREDGFTTTRDELMRNLDVLVRADAARVVLAGSNGRPAGFAITTTSFGLENGLIAELEDLYVVPDERRRGWAGRMIEDAAAWAHRRGAAHLEVVTAPNGGDVSHLNRFYEARGFVDDGRQIRSRPLR